MAQLFNVRNNDQLSGRQLVMGSTIFDSYKSQYLTNTPASDGNKRTFTFSAWVKRSRMSTTNGTVYPTIFTGYKDNNEMDYFQFNENDQLIFTNYNSSTYDVSSDQKFQDNTGWYHVVLAVDSTQGTASNRVKMYVNGEQITTFSVSTYPSQNYDFFINDAPYEQMVGYNGYQYFDGLMSQVYLVDGQQLDPTSFGFTDPLTNTWSVKKYTGTFGTCGFYLPLDGTAPAHMDLSPNNQKFFIVGGCGGSAPMDKATGAFPVAAVNTAGAIMNGTRVFADKTNQTIIISGSSGGGNYVFDGYSGNNPPLSFIRGATYTFDYSAATGHPFRISSTDPDSSTTAYTHGTNVSGNVFKITVPHDAPDTLYYYCTNHSNMNNSISITTDIKKADPYAWKVKLASPLVGINTDSSVSIACSMTAANNATVNGSVTASNLQSVFYKKSALIGGDDDYIDYSEGTANNFNFGTEDFTIEIWAWPISLTTGGFYKRVWEIGAGQYDSLCLTAESNDNYWKVRHNDSIILTSNVTVTLNKWTHIAVVRKSGTMVLFIDGRANTSTGTSYSMNFGSDTFRIGANHNDSTNSSWNGYLQDFRFYRGVAKYYETSYLPASHNNPQIINSSPSGYAPSSKMKRPITGSGSFLAAGTNSYISIPDSDDWNLGSGDFTVECFIYADGLSTNNYEAIIGQWPQNGGNAANSWVLETVGQDLEFYYCHSGTTFVGPIQGGSIAQHEWHHIAAVRSSNTMYIFIDGKMHGTGTSVTHTFNDASSALTIGGYVNSAGYWPGFISNVRVVKGTALYTSNFIPPVSPLKNVTNTKLLCLQDPLISSAAAVTPGTLTVTQVGSSGFNPFEDDIDAALGVPANYATLNTLTYGTSVAISGAGYYKTSQSSSGHERCRSNYTIRCGVNNGKYFFEAKLVAEGGTYSHIGVCNNSDASDGDWVAANSYGASYASGNGNTYHSGGNASSFGDSYTSGDIIGCILDCDNRTLEFFKNGRSQGEAFSSSVIREDVDYCFAVSNAGGSGQWDVNFGQKPFTFPPTERRAGYNDFKTLSSNNLVTGTINRTIVPGTTLPDPREFFNILLHTGNGNASNGVTIDTLTQPDLIWHKNRSTAYHHRLFDSVRGFDKSVYSNKSEAEDNYQDYGYPYEVTPSKINFRQGDDSNNLINVNGSLYVNWCWTIRGHKPHKKTYRVVVVTDSGNKYRWRNSTNDATFAQSALTLTFQAGNIDGVSALYTINMDDSTMDGHPLKFSTTSNGTHGGGSSYNTGVTYLLDGVSVSESTYENTTNFNAATTRSIQIQTSSAITLYYYCHVHSGMGGQINVLATKGDSNLDGTIQTVCNDSPGSPISIVSYTGTGSNGTIGTGLDGISRMAFYKNRSGAYSWAVYYNILTTGGGYGAGVRVLSLNSSDASSYTTNHWNSTTTTNTTASIGTNDQVNKSGNNYISYHFKNIEGLCKIGSFTGNGQSRGPVVICNFKPKWVMIKAPETSSTSWIILDTARNDTNPMFDRLEANSFADEDDVDSSTSAQINVLANGFQSVGGDGTFINSNNAVYFFLAFADVPGGTQFGSQSNAH